MKFCKDCKHYRAAFGPSSDKCVRLFADGKGLVRGESENYCDIQRDNGWFAARLLGECGREGRFFKPKEAK